MIENSIGELISRMYEDIKFRKGRKEEKINEKNGMWRMDRRIWNKREEGRLRWIRDEKERKDRRR